ncbi:hypothetical protein HYALB_00002836 [Hymenoscyphus albidus]|uniref:Uncharacterized protein n=1 Tax=Hymenoscyphus albidus TaxID=595503 RepID=A0A9N9LJ29_9HELO|nr:hypothetical protein HYALB_00002836 [Hymenoscyphus albidus]
MRGTGTEHCNGAVRRDDAISSTSIRTEFWPMFLLLLRTACDCDVNALRRGGGGKGKAARAQFLEFVRSQQSNIPWSIDLNLGPGSNDVVTEYEQAQNRKANSRKGK